MKKRLIVIYAAMILISLSSLSCLYGIKGNGKVVRNERQVEAFESVSASAGLEVILIQDSIVKVVVEADENLQDIIRTEFSNGQLKIYPDEPIRSAKAKRIFVTFKTINSLKATSGAELKSKMDLKLKSLNIAASSGANVDLTLALDELNAEVSSGGNIRLSGAAQNLEIEGSSGGNIIASELSTVSCSAGASSGANLKVYVNEKLSAKASSGGQINVKGNPKERNIEKSSGGDVAFK